MKTKRGKCQSILGTLVNTRLGSENLIRFYSPMPKLKGKMMELIKLNMNTFKRCLNEKLIRTFGERIISLERKLKRSEVFYRGKVFLVDLTCTARHCTARISTFVSLSQPRWHWPGPPLCWPGLTGSFQTRR